MPITFTMESPGRTYSAAVRDDKLWRTIVLHFEEDGNPDAGSEAPKRAPWRQAWSVWLNVPPRTLEPRTGPAEASRRENLRGLSIPQHGLRGRVGRGWGRML